MIAFDLLAGQEVRLSAGLAADALLAAAAIPGVLPPVPWGGRILADGGIANNAPISHAVELGAQRIYVLPTQDPCDRALPGPPRGALAAAAHAITLLAGARLHDDLARYATDAGLIVLPATNPRRIPSTDFSHPGELIEPALHAARAPHTARAAQTATGRAVSGRGTLVPHQSRAS